jgi:hypothetical protein
MISAGKKTTDYPTEYLVARLKGKSNQFPSDWSFITTHPDPLSILRNYPVQEYIDLFQEAGPYYFTYNQYRWIMSQMNRSLLRVFKPFFFYLQIQEIIIILRLRLHGNNEERLRSSIQFSLLEDELCKALIRSTDFSSTLKTVEYFLQEQSPLFNNFAETAMETGWQAAEQALMNHSLISALSLASHKSIRQFIKLLIDKTNLVAQSKTHEWNIRFPPEPISGGNIPAKYLSKIFTQKKSLYITQFYPRLKYDFSSTRELERLFLLEITSSLRKKKISGSSIDYLLFYLWRLHINSRNISLLFTGSKIGTEEYIQ